MVDRYWEIGIYGFTYTASRNRSQSTYMITTYSGVLRSTSMNTQIQTRNRHANTDTGQTGTTAPPADCFSHQPSRTPPTDLASPTPPQMIIASPTGHATNHEHQASRTARRFEIALPPHQAEQVARPCSGLTVDHRFRDALSSFASHPRFRLTARVRPVSECGLSVTELYFLV